MNEATVRIHAERLVHADAATIWRALESERWPWSRFMVGLESRVVGATSTLRLRGVSGGIPIPVALLASESEREIRWSGGIPGVFVGEHYLRLHPEGAATRVEHGEVFSGALGARAAGLVADRLTRLYAQDIDALAAALAAPATPSTPSTPTPGLPDSEAALTRDWLEAAIAPRHPHARVKAVRLADASRAGDGLASTADRLALEVHYEEGRDDDLPSRMLLETILLGKGLRVGPSAIRMLGASLEQLGRLPGGVAARGAVYRGLTRFQERFPQAPYLLPDGSGGLLDWQLMMRGCFAHDVAYVIASGLPTPVRRREERALLAHYLGELAARGVTTAPSLDATFELYRRAVSWGLVIGWLITPPQNYGVELTSANVRRLATAALDLRTFEPGA